MLCGRFLGWVPFTGLVGWEGGGGRGVSWRADWGRVDRGVRGGGEEEGKRGRGRYGGIYLM